MSVLPPHKGELRKMRAADFLAGKDPYGLRYIAYHRARERGEIDV